MKFLIALSVLASSTAFAQPSNMQKIKCYDPAQQGQDKELAYVLVEKNNYLFVAYPKWARGPLTLNQEGCLERSHGTPTLTGRKLEFCEGQGQRMMGLVPVEVSRGMHEDTVYCQDEIEGWFSRNDN